MRQIEESMGSARDRRVSSLAGGFTLLELMVVIFIIAMISAITMPRLMPFILFKEFEGQARHLANYGRSAMGYATLTKDDLKVYFDLDEQVYYTVRVLYPEETEGEGEGEGEQDYLALLNEYSSGMAPGDVAGALAQARATGAIGDLPEDYDDFAANEQMNDKFDRFARRALEERAKNVIPDEGFLGEIGSLFEEEDEFALSLDEITEEEVTDPSLERAVLPEGISIDSVMIDGAGNSSGLIEIELSPLGLREEVAFYLMNDDGEYYTVVWDPLSGGAVVFEGRETIE